MTEQKKEYRSPRYTNPKGPAIKLGREITDLFTNWNSDILYKVTKEDMEKLGASWNSDKMSPTGSRKEHTNPKKGSDKKNENSKQA